MTLSRRGRTIAIVFLFILIGGLLIRERSIPATQEIPTERSLGPGDKATTNRQSLIAIDDAAIDAMNEAVGSGDKIGMMGLMLDGKVFSIEAGIKVNVLATGVNTTKVRVLEGPQIGKAGWITREFLSR